METRTQDREQETQDTEQRWDRDVGSRTGMWDPGQGLRTQARGQVTQDRDQRTQPSEGQAAVSPWSLQAVGTHTVNQQLPRGQFPHLIPTPAGKVLELPLCRRGE